LSKILLFGGSFDPLHCGHLIVSRYVAEHLQAERVILIPARRPPHKSGQSLTPGEHRLEMCRRAVANDTLFAVSDWELAQTGPSYTLLTVQHFREVLPPATQLYWLVGMDSLLELGSWYHVVELIQSCTIVTAARPGYEDPNLSTLVGPLSTQQVATLRANIITSPLIDISATDVRARVSAGRDIRWLVPDPVAAYIDDAELYRAT
jgi:nicotinate-nucleotide adenylyltransferase